MKRNKKKKRREKQREEEKIITTLKSPHLLCFNVCHLCCGHVFEELLDEDQHLLMLLLHLFAVQFNLFLKSAKGEKEKEKERRLHVGDAPQDSDQTHVLFIQEIGHEEGKRRARRHVEAEEEEKEKEKEKESQLCLCSLSLFLALFLSAYQWALRSVRRGMTPSPPLPLRFTPNTKQ